MNVETLWDNVCTEFKIVNFGDNIDESQSELYYKSFQQIEEKYLHDVESERNKKVFDKPRLKMSTDYKYSIDGELAYLLDSISIDALYDNDDAMIIVIGPEGGGKSYLASQIADYLTTKLGVKVTIDNIHFDGEGYLNSSVYGDRLQINILDESKRVLNKMRTTSKSNVEFMNYFSECRDQNQIHILLLPAFTDLDANAAVWRNKLMVSVEKYRHSETNRIVRGDFNIWSTTNKGLLKKAQTKRYERLPKEMLYYSGKFDDVLCYPIEEYNKKKLDAKKERYATNDSPEEKKRMDIEKYDTMKQMRDMKRSWQEVASATKFKTKVACQMWYSRHHNLKKL